MESLFAQGRYTELRAVVRRHATAAERGRRRRSASDGLELWTGRVSEAA